MKTMLGLRGDAGAACAAATSGVKVATTKTTTTKNDVIRRRQDMSAAPPGKTAADGIACSATPRALRAEVAAIGDEVAVPRERRELRVGHGVDAAELRLGAVLVAASVGDENA